jgi:hypothetical protein
MTATVRALVERLAEVLECRSTLFWNVSNDAEVHQAFYELHDAKGVQPSYTRAPHAKANDGRRWLGADLRVGPLTVLISGPMIEVPVVVEAEVG